MALVLFAIKIRLSWFIIISLSDDSEAVTVAVWLLCGLLRTVYVLVPVYADIVSVAAWRSVTASVGLGACLPSILVFIMCRHFFFCMYFPALARYAVGLKWVGSAGHFTK